MFYGVKHGPQLVAGLTQEAFARLYRHFRKPIHLYVRSKVKDTAVAEELTQEVFLKAYRFRARYEEQYAFSTWLWTIARNTIADHLRGTRLRREEGFDSAELIEDVASPQHTAETMVIERDEWRILVKMMRGLTRPQRQVLWLRAIDQLSYEEISLRLGLSLTAVKNLAYRAKSSLTSDLAFAVV